MDQRKWHGVYADDGYDWRLCNVYPSFKSANAALKHYIKITECICEVFRVRVSRMKK